MDFQQVAEIQVVLEGVPLPASRRELIEYARREDARVAEALERIPDGDYDRLDAVGEALMRAAPRRRDEPKLPRPESGKPPGGSDYLNPRPESGAVRPSAPASNPLQRALEQQTQTQKRQQKVQQEA